jgi:hypothetical protein
VDFFASPLPESVQTIKSRSQCQPQLTSGSAHQFELSPARAELVRRLRKTRLSLAELYEGALRMMMDRGFPGRVRFIAHAVREIRNRLPDTLSGKEKLPHGGDVNRLDEIVKKWERHGLPMDGSVPESLVTEPKPEVSSSQAILLPRKLFHLVAQFLGDHRAARMTNKEIAARLFDACSPPARPAGGVLKPAILQWLAVTEWFVQRAHDSGKPDADCDEGELCSQFQLFEATLGALVGSFYNTLDELDAILEEANS